MKPQDQILLLELLPLVEWYSEKVLLLMEPHGQSPWYLTYARVGRHPGHTIAHSSTAKAVVFCCRDKKSPKYTSGGAMAKVRLEGLTKRFAVRPSVRER